MKQKLNNIALIISVIIVSLAAGFVLAQWTEPTSAPPGEIVPTPINVSSNYQWKEGGLGIGTGAFSLSAGEMAADTYYGGIQGSYYLRPSGNSVLRGNLEVGVDTSEGHYLKLPNLTTIQRDALVPPAYGMMIYNSDNNRVEYYIHDAWVEIVPPYTEGQACVTNFDCMSGYCIDGYCCDTACTGDCESCDQIGHIGECTVNPEDDNTKVTKTCYYCDGISSTPVVSSKDEGYNCTGDCTHCVIGTCTTRSSGDNTETAACHYCNGISSASVASSEDEGHNCTGDCTHCVSGSCNNWPNNERHEGCSNGCQICQSGLCTGPVTLTDSRNGKTYAVILIGTQCWMKQGLNIGTRIDSTNDQINNGIIEKYCHNNTDANCDSSKNPNYPDGGLYQWNEAMQYSTTEGAQGICPTGWHIPTDAELCTLEQTVDSSITCDSTGWRGTDGGAKLRPYGSSGFEGNLAGFRNTIGWFGARNSWGWFWSSLESGSGAWIRSLEVGGNIMVSREVQSKSYGASVRCIKN